VNCTLQELRRAAQLSRDELGDLDVEANQLRWIAGVRFDKRRSALGITAPPQRLRCGGGRKATAHMTAIATARMFTSSVASLT
jgi:hypothetical protein